MNILQYSTAHFTHQWTLSQDAWNSPLVNFLKQNTSNLEKCYITELHHKNCEHCETMQHFAVQSFGEGMAGRIITKIWSRKVSNAAHPIWPSCPSLKKMFFLNLTLKYLLSFPICSSTPIVLSPFSHLAHTYTQTTLCSTLSDYKSLVRCTEVEWNILPTKNN